MIKLVNGLLHNEEESKRELCDFIQSTSQLSIGKECQVFEENFAVWQGRRHCILFNSGSSANLALIQALLNMGTLKRGEQAGFSAITWATNVMPLIQLGLDPVPIDVEKSTLNVSGNSLVATLEDHPHLRMVFLTNLLGFCDDIDEIARLCNERGIIFIEDNCESLGSVYKGVKLGNWGLGSTFSFYVGHHMSTIEGGAVCTDDDELALMLKMVRAHGWDRNLSDEEKGLIRERYGVENDMPMANFTFYTLGYNLRPTEITGFLGNQQLRYLSEQLSLREEYFYRIHGIMQNNPDLLSVDRSHMDSLPSFAVPLIAQNADLADLYKDIFAANDVEVRPLLGGSIVDQPFFKNQQSRDYDCKNAKELSEQGFYFPNHEGLSESDLERLCSVVSRPMHQVVA